MRLQKLYHLKRGKLRQVRMARIKLKPTRWARLIRLFNFMRRIRPAKISYDAETKTVTIKDGYANDLDILNADMANGWGVFERKESPFSPETITNCLDTIKRNLI